MSRLRLHVTDNSIEILEQAEELRGLGPIYSRDGYIIQSINAPANNGTHLYIRGSWQNYDNALIPCLTISPEYREFLAEAELAINTGIVTHPQGKLHESLVATEVTKPTKLLELEIRHNETTRTVILTTKYKDPRFIHEVNYAANLRDIQEHTLYYTSEFMLVCYGRAQFEISYISRIKGRMGIPGTCLGIVGINNGEFRSVTCKEIYSQDESTIVRKFIAFLKEAELAINTGKIVNPQGKFGDLYMQQIRGDQDEIKQRKLQAELVYQILNQVPKPKLGVYIKYIGVEVEMLVHNPKGLTLEGLVKQLLTVIPSPVTKDTISIDTDGSLEGEVNYTPLELRVLAPVEEIREVLGNVLTGFHEMGVMVNKSCGLHVHLDQRSLQEHPIKLYQVYNQLTTAMPLLHRFIPATRRGYKYCTSTVLSERQAMGAIVNGGGAHYDGISMHSYKKYQTIEVRLHSGTTNLTKIVNWIDLLLAIEAVPLDKSDLTVDAMQSTLTKLKLDEDQVAYFMDRYRQFSDPEELDIAS